jgi:hypothetical protein
MKIEYNGFIVNELDTASSDAEILQNFLERTMVFDTTVDTENLIIQFPSLTFEDLIITRTQFEVNVISKRYLAETDWYVSRYSETGVPVPADILLKRQEARDAIIGETI